MTFIRAAMLLIVIGGAAFGQCGAGGVMILNPLNSPPTWDCTGLGGAGTGNVTTGVTLTADLPVIGAGTTAIGIGTKTGTGTTFATNTSPTFITPALGVATATSINGLTITTSTGTLTVVNGGSLITAGAFAGTLTFTNTTNATVPAGTVTLLSTASTATLTNKTYDTAGTGNSFSINGVAITGVEGNTAKVQLFSGSDPATNDCAKFDANHNLVSAGAACGSGSATVTSVAQSFTGGLISVAGSPITTSGTLALTVAGTSGGVPYFSSGSTWASSTAPAANLPMIWGGAGAAPTSGTRSGNTTAFVTTTGTQTSGDCVTIDANGNHVAAGAACGSGSGGTAVAPYSTTFSSQTSVSISAATHGQGTLAVAYCYDASTPRVAVACSYTRNTSGDLVFTFSPSQSGQIEVGSGGGTATPLTTKGDIISYSTLPVRVGIGTDGQVLTADSASTPGLKWATVTGTGTVTSAVIAGTANQITASGTCTITTTGTCTLSIPTNPTLPGNTTGTFIGNITGNVTGNTSGTAATITGLIVEANTPLTTKGDLLVEDGTTLHRLAVGSNGQVLTADSAQTDGVKWATVSGTGDVVGPGSATDNAIVRFDGTTGKLVQDSAVTIADTTGTITTPGVFVSTIATGTAPLTVSSTTNVANLNASSLSGATFAAPGAIGGTTPAAGHFTTLDATGAISSGTSPPAVTAGTGGVFASAEGTAPSVGLPAASVDGCYADSTAHGLKCSFNNDTAAIMARGPSSSTANHAPTFSSTDGGLLKDSGLTLTASTGTFTLTNGKTFAVTHGLTLSGTDSTVMTFPSTSATIARTDAANTFTGTQSFAGAIIAGTDNSAAGTLQLANSAANAHTIWSSGATTTNTIQGFAAVPTTGHLIDCTVTSTTCLMHDSGVVTANVVNASSPGVGLAHFAGSTQTVTSSLVVNADITNTTIDVTSKITGLVPLANGGTNCATPYAVNPQTSTYQALAADFTCSKTITVASGTFTITLVASGSQPVAGSWIKIVNYGSGVVTVARSGQNINGGTASLTIAAASATAPTSAQVWSDGTNYFGQITISAGGGGGTVTDNVWIPFGGNLDGNGGRDLGAGAGFGTGSAPVGVSLVNGAGGAVTAVNMSPSGTAYFFVPYRLHDNWSGTVNLDIEVGNTNASTGVVLVTVQTACAAANVDILALTYNTVQNVSLTVPTAASGEVKRSIAAISGLTMTGCNAGDQLWLKVGRTGGSGGDTYTGAGYYIGAVLKYGHS